jgi:uncharacterized protein YjbI with pentapeptide repeats
MTMGAEISSDQRPVIPASEILAKIERGEDVEYDGVIVEGDLDISGLDLPTEYVERTKNEKRQGLTDKQKLISSKITIINSDIGGKVKFSNTRFQELINFNRSKFTSAYTDFRGVKFGGDAHFELAEFTGSYVNLEGAEFCGDANFGGAELDKIVIFWGAKFTGGAVCFRGAKFAFVSFESAKFTAEDIDFKGGIDFREVEFSDDVHFEFSRIHRQLC